MQQSKIVLLISLFATLFFTTFASVVHSETLIQLSSDVFLIGASAVLSLITIIIVKKLGFKTALGRLYILLFIYAIFFCLGETSWKVMEQILKISPTPSIADFFWLSGDAILFVFVSLYLRRLGRTTPKKIIAFSIVVGIALLVPSLFIAYTISANLNSLQIAVAIGYPVADTAILGLTVIGFTSISKYKKSFLPYLLLSMISLIFADTFYLSIISYGGFYQTGNLVDVGWYWSYIILSFGLVRSRHNLDFPQDNTRDNVMSSIPSETILNFVIPFVLVSVIVIMALLIVSTQYLATDTEKINNFKFFDYIIFAVIGIFSTIVVLINKNLMKVVKIRTAELERDRANLEQLVKEKTNAILKNERMAAIGELSSRLAHDLRNPLSVIKTTNALVKVRIPNMDEKMKEDLIRGDRAISRMVHQIDDVLGFVRSRVPKKTRIKISNILKLTFDRIVMPDTIKINLQSDGEVFCDGEQMSVVLANMITNSIHAMNGNGIIKIRFMAQNDDIIIEVEDSGEGIPKHILPKIFEPLFTTRQDGTGLGLATCKNVVEGHGGTIEVKSEPGKGTTFSIKLPKEKIKIQNFEK